MKGTVTSLASIFPAEEAQKASKRVQDTIADHQKELDRLRDFIADNTNLINLVQKLPDELHHDVMVPFGKAAFFPGNLRHTNEFLVLLGEGYYVERTSKQTIEILKRREKVLESQVDSFKAMMLDLKAEASFFDATAADAAEGLVEIREDYVEENSIERVSATGLPKPDSPNFSEADNMEVVVEDDEYARMLSRIDELEKEELASESLNDRVEDEQTESDFGHLISQHSLDRDLRTSGELQQSMVEYATTEKFLSKNHFQQYFADQLNFDGLKVQAVPKDESSHGKSLLHYVKKSNSTEKALMLPERKENVQALPTSKNEVSVQTSTPGTDSSKAFTGSIVEHTHNTQSNPREQTAASSQPSQSSGSHHSKPVSRFKMQRK